MRVAALTVATIAVACRLGPLVDDVPGASVHLLAADAVVPSVADNAELANQIAVNDGVDDDALAANNGVLARGTGASAGNEVHYWSFGPATFAQSPLYQFFEDIDGVLTPIDHPGLVDAIPGDDGYSPFHTLVNVVVTPAYAGEQITTTAALGDAIELGLVHPPSPTSNVVASPIVLPGTRLEVGGSSVTAMPVVVFARGYQVAMFPLGGALGVQPRQLFQPTSQVSFLREAKEAGYNASRPVFQATIPTAPAVGVPNYTPLSVVLDVDLAMGVKAGDIDEDSDLFERMPTGAILRATDKVSAFQIASTSLVLQIQFVEGQP